MNEPSDLNEPQKYPASLQDGNGSITLFSRSVDDAMCALRILGPADAANIQVIRGVEDGIIHFERVDEGNLVVIQRDFCRELDAYEKVISLAHAVNKPVVLDLDDLLL